MIRAEEYLKLRIDLLRSHLQEWQLDADRHTQARTTLVDNYKIQRNQLLSKDLELKRAMFLVQYTDALIDLSNQHEQEREALRQRHATESAELEAQIKSEKSNYSRR